MYTNKPDRVIKCSQALDEATLQALEINAKAFVMGLGVDDPKGAFGTTVSAFKKFGSERVFDMPMAESAMTGVAVGAALNGHFPIVVHLRFEFLLLGIDQLLNHAAKWKYMFGGGRSVPLLIRCIVGRGWGQAAQHSQSLHALFAHLPGIQVVMPSTPYDAKGLLISAVRGSSPVLMVEHRWLHEKSGHVPVEPYSVPIGPANIVRTGKDVTIVAVSYQVFESLQAATALEKEGVEVEVIDLRCIKPIDTETILSSLKKTGHLVVVDNSHKSFGVTAEIAALAVERGFSYLKAPVARVAFPEAPTPCSPELEKMYYPGAADIVQAVHAVRAGKSWQKDSNYEIRVHAKDALGTFVGPF